MRTRYFCLDCGEEFVGEFHTPNPYTGHEQGGPIAPGEGPILARPAAPAYCAACRSRCERCDEYVRDTRQHARWVTKEWDDDHGTEHVEREGHLCSSCYALLSLDRDVTEFEETDPPKATVADGGTNEGRTTA